MKAFLYAGLGAVLLATGLYLQFGTAEVSAADRMRCEQAVRTTYGDSNEARDTLLPKCNEAGMVAMMDAKTAGSGANEAAQAIAAANHTDLLGILLRCALIGAGIGALGSAAVSFRRPRKRSELG